MHGDSFTAGHAFLVPRLVDCEVYCDYLNCSDQRLFAEKPPIRYEDLTDKETIRKAARSATLASHQLSRISAATKNLMLSCFQAIHTGQTKYADLAEIYKEHEVENAIVTSKANISPGPDQITMLQLKLRIEPRGSTRPRGRPPKRWADDITDSTKVFIHNKALRDNLGHVRRRIGILEAKRAWSTVGRDRVTWRSLVRSIQHGY
uniref:Uncharacterized protein n=1 Tax=Caenorhabditis japonica TaxID=281687 RepID=A0A8R1E7Z8_CAEJA